MTPAEKIAGARVREQPFPYIVVRDVLPEQLYARMLAHWPDHEAFRVTNFARRRQIDLERREVMAPADPELWDEVLAAANTINRALFNRFGAYMDLKFRPLFGPNWRALGKDKLTISYTGAQLADYGPTGGLHAHVDSPRVVVNSFLYMSERDASEPEFGTVLYRTFGLALPENNIKIGAKLQDRVTAPHVIVPYRRNCMVAFLNTPSAFHGVKEFNMGERSRRLALFSVLLRSSDTDMSATFANASEVVLDEGDV